MQKKYSFSRKNSLLTKLMIAFNREFIHMGFWGR